MRPHFKREREHGGRVAGVDEVGRGPLAGPVVAVAVVFPGGVPRRVAPLIDDSKKLTAPEREAAAIAIRRCAEIGIGAASVAEIETLNILHAAMLAMRRAVLRLQEPPHLALVDGNRAPTGLPCPAECCIGGDAISLSIAAASIIAKVTRDHAMRRLSARYPAYGWHENAGYGTPAHRAALHRHGPTRHHRVAFGTVRLLSQSELAFISEAAD
jgi:ribonuclease HII